MKDVCAVNLTKRSVLIRTKEKQIEEQRVARLGGFVGKNNGHEKKN